MTRPTDEQLREIADFLELRGFESASVDWLRSLCGQPAPLPGEGDVWAELIQREHDPVLRVLFARRRQVGIERYGVPLQRGNGRDALQDALDEALDLYVYASSIDRETAGNIPILARIAIRDISRAMRERDVDSLVDTLDDIPSDEAVVEVDDDDSAFAMHRIVCDGSDDGNGCPSDAVIEVSGPDYEKARWNAERYGWHRFGFATMCPACWSSSLPF